MLRLRFGWADDRIIARLKLLTKVAGIVLPKTAIQAIKEDDDDNRILECAVAGKADLIVSNDHHLRRLKAFEGIGIVHPIDFRRTWGHKLSIYPSAVIHAPASTHPLPATAHERSRSVSVSTHGFSIG